MDWLRQLDAFPKALDDFRIKTKSGAVVSLIAISLMCLLFVEELKYFYRIETLDRLYVNPEVNSTTLRVSFDFSFPIIPCNLLSIDAVDDMGLTQPLLWSEVYKHRIDSSGNVIGEKQTHEIGDTIRTEDEIKALAKLPEIPDVNAKCGNCYGSAPVGTCCNTCQEVRDSYARIGWRFKPQDILQCRREAAIETLKEQNEKDGGCQIYGNLHLSRTSGHFHVAPHTSIHKQGEEQQELTFLDLLSFTFAQFNITHTINSLSFGTNFPGYKSPLDGQERVVQDTHGMHQYYIKVVPTRYKSYGAESAIESNQYSVTEHLRHLAPGSGRGLPGVYFYYEVSPVMAVFEETRGTFLRFLTSICAILGGLFTVMGILDHLFSAVWTYFKKDSLRS